MSEHEWVHNTQESPCEGETVLTRRDGEERWLMIKDGTWATTDGVELSWREAPEMWQRNGPKPSVPKPQQRPAKPSDNVAPGPPQKQTQFNLDNPSETHVAQPKPPGPIRVSDGQTEQKRLATQTQIIYSRLLDRTASNHELERLAGSHNFSARISEIRAYLEANGDTHHIPPPTRDPNPNKPGTRWYRIAQGPRKKKGTKR